MVLETRTSNSSVAKAEEEAQKSLVTAILYEL